MSGNGSFIHKPRFWISQGWTANATIRFPAISGRALRRRPGHSFDVQLRVGTLIDLVRVHAPHYLRTKSYQVGGFYHTECPNARLREALEQYRV
jgi:hypothetical protein